MGNTLLKLYRDSLREQGIDDRRDDLILMREYLVPLAQENPELLSAYPDFADEVRAVRDADSPSTMRGIVNTAKSAYDRSLQAWNVTGGIDDTDAQDISVIEKRIRERPSSRAWEDWQNPNITGIEAAKVFARDPIEILSNIVTSGVAGSIPAIVGGLGGGAAGAKGGALIGAGFGPPGAAIGAGIGGTVGTAVGVGAGSLSVEFGNKYLEVLRDSGADLADPESILRVLQDPELRGRARSLAWRRSIPVATFDAVSGGIAGKLSKGFKGASAAGKVGRVAAEGGAGGAIGGLGEIAGAISAGEEIRPGAVFEEIAGDVVPSVIQAAGAGLRRRIAGDPQLPGATPLPAPMPPTPAPASVLAEPVIPTTPTRSRGDIVVAVERMDDAQRAQRLAELQAIPARTEELDLEMQLLLARGPSSPRAPVVAPVSNLAEPDVDPAIVAPVTPPAPQVAPPEVAPAVPAAVVSPEPPAPVQPQRRPDSDYLYTVQRAQPHPDNPTLTIPGYTQIDQVVNGGRGEPLTDEQRAALPQPPEWLPAGKYTLEQITDAIAAGPPASTAEPVDAAAPSWLKDETARLYASAQQIPDFEQTVEELSAKRLTAKQIVTFLRQSGILTNDDPEARLEEQSMVRVVREKLGIPSMDQATEFEAWINARKPAPPVPPKEAAPAVAAQADFPKPSEVPPVVPSTAPTPEEHAAAKAVETPVPQTYLTPELRLLPEVPELAGRMVQLEALTDSGERVVAEIDAAQAWSDTQKQIGVYRRLLDCLKGAA